MISGAQLKNAIISGSNNISKYKKQINELNIFPVPDGDTGTNMSMTIGAAAEEIAEVEEEELVDPNSLVNNFSIDDPVRMYLKEIGKVPLLSPDEEIVLAQALTAGNEATAQLANLKACREAGEPVDATPEQEAAWRKDYRAGEAAKQKLAEANLRLVVSIAKR